MPCFLFTYHAYGSWLPDRDEGFVHWKEGPQKSDDNLGKAYRRKMKFPEAELGESLQKLLIDELQTASRFQRFRLHAIATEPTHVHALVSWPDDRGPSSLSDGVKKSLSLRLSRDAAKRSWFSKGGHDRHVKNQAHFDYLIGEYLPSHSGWKWDERRGCYR